MAVFILKFLSVITDYSSDQTESFTQVTLAPVVVQFPFCNPHDTQFPLMANFVQLIFADRVSPYPQKGSLPSFLPEFVIALKIKI